MCGICGIVSFKNQRVNQKALEYMNSVMAHRGPDGEGLFMDDGETISFTDFYGKLHQIDHPWPVKGDRAIIGLGHRRLAILDLTEAGHQPMADREKRFWIVYNGEVYNYIELAEELKSLGHQFQSRCDTEVIPAAFKQWGEDCFNRFNGMWAFALWDARERKLVMSRDRFAIKPFFLLRKNDSLIFASETKALSAFSERRADSGVLGAYLLRGTVDHHPARTFFRGVERLEAGHYLVLKNGGEKQKPYWDPAVPDESIAPPSFERACHDFMELFMDSVRIRLRSDVPVGSCLSGGLDSSAIVSAIAGIRKKERGDGFIQHTVTAYYGGTAADEWPYAKIVAENAGAVTHKAEAGPKDLEECIDKFIFHQDEPFYGLSMYAQWCVFREAKQQGLTVMEDGQGADEMLAGYEPWDRYLKDLAQKGGMSEAWRELRAWSKRTDRSVARNLARTIFPVHGLIRSIYTERFLKEAEPSDYVPKDLQAEGQGFLAEIDFDVSDLHKNLYTLWSRTSLPALLRFEDRNSMAHSIEARLPFLDYRLMRLAFSLQPEYKLRDGWTKAALREGVKGLVPDEVRLRKIKQGFPTPQKEWMSDKLTNMVMAVLSDKKTRERGWYDMKALEKSLEDADFLRSQFSWRIINAELWARNLLECEDAPAPFLE